MTPCSDPKNTNVPTDTQYAALSLTCYSVPSRRKHINRAVPNDKTDKMLKPSTCTAHNARQSVPTTCGPCCGIFAATASTSCRYMLSKFYKHLVCESRPMPSIRIHISGAVLPIAGRTHCCCFQHEQHTALGDPGPHSAVLTAASSHRPPVHPVRTTAKHVLRKC